MTKLIRKDNMALQPVDGDRQNLRVNFGQSLLASLMPSAMEKRLVDPERGLAMWKLERKAIKWLIHQLTGMSEIERILNGERYHSVRMSRAITKSINLSTKMENVRQLIFFTQATGFDVNCVATMIADIKKLQRNDAIPRLQLCLRDIQQTSLCLSCLDRIRRTDVLPDCDGPSLDKLWHVFCLGKKRTGDQDWVEIGFQGSNPYNDFRGSGKLGLQVLLLIAEHEPDLARNCIGNYPELLFSVVVINFVMLTSRMFETRELDYLFFELEAVQDESVVAIFSRQCVENLSQFYEDYWRTGSRNVMDFTNVIKTFESNKFKTILQA